MKISGLKFGGRIARGPSGERCRSIPIATFHHPDRMCWLWFLHLTRCIADERRGFRAYRMRGSQDRRVLQFWNMRLEFLYQEEGRYRNYKAKQQSKLSRLMGVRFD